MQVLCQYYDYIYGSCKFLNSNKNAKLQLQSVYIYIENICDSISPNKHSYTRITAVWITIAYRCSCERLSCEIVALPFCFICLDNFELKWFAFSDWSNIELFESGKKASKCIRLGWSVPLKHFKIVCKVCAHLFKIEIDVVNFAVFFISTETLWFLLLLIETALI